MSEPNWQTLKRGEWFYSYCADAVHPHTVAERTDSGWVAVCAMTYANDAAEADARLIVKLKSSAGLVPSPVTRFEVIHTTGRVFTRWGCKVQLSYQDDGRTLKVFVQDDPALPSSPLRSPKETP